MKMVDMITADRIALTLCPIGMPPVPPYSSLAEDIQNTNLLEKSWMFQKLLDYCLIDDDQLEFLLNCGPNYQATWEPRRNVPEEAFSRLFTPLRRTTTNRRKHFSEVSSQENTSTQRQQISASEVVTYYGI